MNHHLRKVGLKLLKVFGDQDIKITHHWTKDRMTVNLYRHRGYWYKGVNREPQTMRDLLKIVKPGSTCFEIGGHIGYVSLILRQAVGEEGSVYVFEPGSNNYNYLEANTRPYPNIKIINLAISDHSGEVDFFTEDITGQNNSLKPDYSQFRHNQELQGAEAVYTKSVVQAITLDAYIEKQGVVPDSIKIDIEGAELLALRGAVETLRSHRPVIMIEITEDNAQVTKLFREHNYRLFNPGGQECINEVPVHGNTFCIPAEQGNILIS